MDAAIKAAYEALSSATLQLATALGMNPGDPGVPEAGPNDWMKPTAAQAAAFAAKVGLTVDQVLGWDRVGPNIHQTKLSALAVGDVKGAKEYAGFGYRPDGTHYLWTRDWLSGQRAFAFRLVEAPDAAALEALCTGAAAPGVETEAVAYAFLIGLSEAPQFTPFRSPSFGMGKGVLGEGGVPERGEGYACTIEDIVLFMQIPQGTGGAGPSGRPV